MQLHCVSGNVLCKIKHQTDVSKHVLVEEHLRIIGNIFDISIIGKCLLSENVYYMSIIGKRLLYVYYRKICTFFLRKWVEQQTANKLDIFDAWVCGNRRLDYWREMKRLPTKQTARIFFFWFHNKMLRFLVVGLFNFLSFGFQRGLQDQIIGQEMKHQQT